MDTIDRRCSQHRRLTFERLEDRQLLALVASAEAVGISGDFTVNGYYDHWYYDVDRRNVVKKNSAVIVGGGRLSGAWDTSFNASVVDESYAFSNFILRRGDGIYIDHDSVALGSGNGYVVAAAQGSFNVTVLDEGDGVTRYTISASAAASVEVAKSANEPLVLPEFGDPFWERYYLTGTSVKALFWFDWDVAWHLTDPREFVISDQKVVTTRTIEPLIVGLPRSATEDSKEAEYVYSFTETIRVAKGPRLQSLDFGGSGEYSILPDPGTNDSRFDPSKSDYVDDNLDGDPEQQHPILYAAGKIPAVTVEFKLPNIDGGTYQLRGTGPDEFVFLSSAPVLTNDGIKFANVSASKAFGPQVKKYDEFSIEWELSADGGETWSPAGTSSNTLYVSAAPPRQLVDAAFPNLNGIYETIVNVAITRNVGRTAANRLGIIGGTWTYFDMNASDDATRIDGTPLSYWGDGYKTQNHKNSVTFLLGLATGTCGMWTDFFQDVLAVNGILTDEVVGDGELTVESPHSWDLQMKYWKGDKSKIIRWEALVTERVFLQPGRAQFASWRFPYGTEEYPYFHVSDWDRKQVRNLTQGGFVELTDVVHEGGLPAQHKDDPVDQFTNHALVRIGGTIYDPSYGRSYQTVSEWEDAALAGFAFVAEVTYGFGSSEGNIYSGKQDLFREQTRGQLDVIVSIEPETYVSFPDSAFGSADVVLTPVEEPVVVAAAKREASKTTGWLHLAPLPYALLVAASREPGLYEFFSSTIRLNDGDPASATMRALFDSRWESTRDPIPAKRSASAIREPEEVELLAFEKLMDEWKQFSPTGRQVFHDLS